MVGGGERRLERVSQRGPASFEMEGIYLYIIRRVILSFYFTFLQKYSLKIIKWISYSLKITKWIPPFQIISFEREEKILLLWARMARWSKPFLNSTKTLILCVGLYRSWIWEFVLWVAILGGWVCHFGGIGG